MNENATIYEMAGGEAVFRELVERFYGKIQQDADLRGMFPDDLEPGKRWQLLFLTQYFSGEQVYSAERGHPRLRMRHAPYPIDRQARDAWLRCMLESIDEVGIPEPARSVMREYFENGSQFIINTVRPDDEAE